MKTEKIDLRILRNDEHFQFHTEVSSLINTVTPDALKIQAQYDAYQSLYVQEDEALKKIVKSALTDDIEKADRQRDLTFSGMATVNRAALNHFNAETVSAARRLQIVFDTYGNLARKPVNEETSAIYNFLQELNGAYSGDVAAVGITGWVEELAKNNNAVDALMKGRYNESAKRTDLVLREVRIQLDAVYRIIAERIDALMLIEGGETLQSFIRRLNVIIKKYSDILARRTSSKAPAQGTAPEAL
ncbi:MAG: DUF6261 family protein [Prevotellaceae bacterium]|nr:DUF6261 family protein [Prevotellaceae bacterium]